MIKHPHSTVGARMLAKPGISETHIAFVYDNSLWRVSREGGDALRLTGANGSVQNPIYSPDGRWLAFSANYAGQIDVYVMPGSGGEVRRLTWHPGDDIVRGFRRRPRRRGAGSRGRLKALLETVETRGRWKGVWPGIRAFG